MPTQATDIEQEIQYILQYWIQNNNHAITGTIGQNVVWNLAQFIKQLPENYQKASVVSQPTINYTTNKDECVVIFNNDSKGKLNWVDNRWNKYYFVNATDNERLFSNGKIYFDINGDAKVSIPARTSLYIAKGNDDYWYEIASASGGSAPSSVTSLRLIVGEEGAPVEGESTWQNDSLIGLGGDNDRYIFTMDCITMMSYGNSQNFDFNSANGVIDIKPNQWVSGTGVDCPLIKTV